jgi:hypothetical protein
VKVLHPPQKFYENLPVVPEVIGGGEETDRKVMS